MCEYGKLALNMKNPWIVVGAIALVLIVGAVLYSNTIENNYDEGVEIISHTKGNQDSNIKLVEYSDFQCPACASFQVTLEALFEQVGEDISFEYKSFPLSLTNPGSMLSAMAAEAAGQQGKFFEYHDVLFENQQEWASSPTPNVFFTQYAEELDLDIGLFKKHMKSSLLRDKMKTNRTEGINMGVKGTPNFFLNGELMKITSQEDFINQVLSAVNPVFSSSTERNINSGGVKFGI